MEIVSCLLDQIKATEEACEQLEKSDISIPIRKMELARIRFMIASYMRLRLQKIQKNVHFLSKLRSQSFTSLMVADHYLLQEDINNRVSSSFSRWLNGTFP